MSQPYPQYPQPHDPHQPPAWNPAPPYGQPPAAPTYGYAPQPAPQYGYGPSAPQAPAGPPPAPGTLGEFYSQPSTGGGPSIKFNNKPNGTSYTGVIARDLVDTDVRAQTDRNQNPIRHADGRQKFVLVIPLIVPVSQDFPQGRATWWVKGASRDELAAAMQRAGSTASKPEGGATVTVTKTGERQIPGLNNAIEYAITYQPPVSANGQAPAPEPVQPVAAPVPQGQTWQQPPAPPAYAPQTAPQQVQPAPVQPQAPQPVQAAPAAQQGQPELTPLQLQMMQQLANGGVPPQQG